MVDRGLEVAVRRFGVAVLVRLTRVDPLTRQTVVIQEIAVAGLELPRRRVVVHRRGQAVAAVLPRHATEFPQRLLQTVRQRFERLRRTHRHRFPVRVGQHEVVHQVIERLPRDRDAQIVHAGEVRRREVPGLMHLAEHDRAVRPGQRPPLPHPPLEGAAMRIEELARVVLAEPVEECLGQEPRLGTELPFDLGPDRRERINPGAVGARQLLLAPDARERRVVSVMSGRLLGHPCPP